MNVRTMVSKVRGLSRAMQSQYALAKLLVRMELLSARAKARKARIDTETEEALKELRAKIEPRARTLFEFYRAQREALPASASGTIARTEAGVCEWYPGADSIEVTDEMAAIAFLEKMEEEVALRRRVELNKEYLLEHQELIPSIPGIRLVQKPKRILRFTDTKARIEVPEESGTMEIVFPKKKQ